MQGYVSGRLKVWASLALWLGFTFQLSTLLASTLGQIPSSSQPAHQELSAEVLRQQIEDDWLRQAKASGERAAGTVSTRTDALGACDGIKNGKYGFHTGLEPNPWWQVDLEAVTPIARIVVFNRLDYAPGLHNADQLRILTSEDGKNWTVRHENTRHFGGVSGAKPLEVTFPEGTRAQFVRLQVVSDKPIFFHLDEVEVYAPGDNKQNLALHRQADQSSTSQWSTAKFRTSAVAVYPTEQFIQRGKRLAGDLQKMGFDGAESVRRLENLEREYRAQSTNVPDELRRKLYLKVRWQVRALAFSNPLLNFQQLLFVKRFCQETYPDVCLNHMPWVSRPGGDICVLSTHIPPESNLNLIPKFNEPINPIRSAASSALSLDVRQILNSSLGPGHVHGMDLSWEGRRIVFGYSRAKSEQPPTGWLDRTRSYDLRRTEEPTHIFEIDVNGKNLRQLSSGEWSDLDPCYAPNGDIVFVSERCGTSLQCNEYDKDETSCNLYVMKPDGSGIRRLSVSKDGDYLPHALDDGNIAYTRWEYHERSWAFIQSIWVVKPDGTGADAIFKQHFVNPWALEDTRSIPGSSKLVAIAAGHHTLAVGPLVVVNPSIGVNDPRGIAIVTPDVKPPEGGMDGVPVTEGGVTDGGGFYSTPWALSEKYFLVAYTYGQQQVDPAGYALYLVDVFGNKELIFRDAAISCFMPMPLRARPRPPVYPEMVDLTKNYAECALSEASFGAEKIAPGRARYIRISEPIGWPYDNTRGGQRYGEDHGYGGPDAQRKNLLSWTPIRILGDVPLESDGSARFKVPVDTAVYFQLLDENRMELRRMRSFISFQPGEVRACAGCHESRGVAAMPAKDSLALQREPAELLRPPWGDRPVNFLRDVQPVLDAHCVRCHRGLKPAGGLDFGGGLISYDQRIPGYGHNRAYQTIMEKELVSISKVRAQDASITPPLAYGARFSKLLTSLHESPHDKEVHLGKNDELRLAMWIDANAPYHDTFVNKRPDEPAYDLAADQELSKQITAVHERRCSGCHKPAEISRLEWVNLLQPEQSLFLTAPLPSTNLCTGAVYKSQDDSDYQSLLALVKSAVLKARKAPRRDLEHLAISKN